MVDPIAQMVRRVEELERRTRRMIVYGIVTDVDQERRLVRVDDGTGTEGEPNKTDWLPWAELAGGLKTKTLPSVGQNVVVLSPSGSPEIGTVIPGTFTDDNPKPDADDDDYVLTNGQVSLKIKGGTLTIASGATEIEIKGDAVNIKSESTFTVGKTYLGVDDKNEKPGVKMQTAGGEAKKVFSKIGA